MIMEKKMIYMCGHFAGNSKRFDGQTIKTRLVFEQLTKKYGEDSVRKIDTCGWKKRPFSILIECIKASRVASNIIIMPSMNGVKVFVPLFVRLKERYNFKLHYVVIGGWICDIITNSKKVAKAIGLVDYIYLENYKTIDKLKTMGLNNVHYMANFKDLRKTDSIKCANDEFRCCIFSRIEKPKGILDAVNVIGKYNDEHEKKVYLDIYGKIKDVFRDEFMRAIDGNKYIKYLGVVEPDKSVEIIEKYDLLLFPTKYKTEGIPGTIIDAYFAGTPILASKWDNFDEIIVEGETGFGYQFDNIDDFYSKLVGIIKNRERLAKMSNNCLGMVDRYFPENATRVLINNLGGVRICR